MICAYIQARMSSERLPGKVLLNINEKPMLFYMIERVKCAKTIDKIIIVKSLRQFFMDKDNLIAEKKYHSMEKFSWERVADQLLELFAQRHKEQKKNYHEEWIR